MPILLTNQQDIGVLRDRVPQTNGKPRVLIVEDHDDTRLLYRYVLEMLGYMVQETAAGDEAFQIAQSNPPDLVLMDTNLPKVDGFTLTRSIRKCAAIKNVPIIFISGDAQPKCRELALAAGGNDYLVKPVKLEEFEQAVRRQLVLKARKYQAVRKDFLPDAQPPLETH